LATKAHIYLPPPLKEPLILRESYQVQHIHALRVRKGERITLFDGEGNVHLCIVEQISKESVMLKRERSCKEEAPKVQLALFQAVPKMGKMRQIVNACAQMGVWRIHPLLSERTISSAERGRIKHWQKVSISATEQSRGAWVCKIGEAMEFYEAVKEAKHFPLSLLLHEGAQLSFKDVLKGCFDSKVALFVGPEGGFTQKEVKIAQDAGFLVVHLGSRILRVETAAVVASFLILYELGG
jgi:16S rRNA (uracil1498-N3)-methyltransferase